MWRLLIGFLVVAALAALGAWAVENPGRVALEWGGWRLETSAPALVLALLVCLVIVVIALSLLRRVFGAGAAYGRSRREKQRNAGYAEFARGMVALAAGDARGAASAAAKVEKLLPQPELTLLLSAQAAQLAGDEAGAKMRFSAMLDNPRTALLGLRGLLSQAVAANDVAAMRDLARRAVALRADAPWALAALLDAEIRQRDWTAARLVLDKALAAKAIGSADGHAKKAALLVEEARVARAANDMRAARKAGEAAVALVRGFAPATVELSGIYAALGKKRRARNLLRAAWAAAPHPALMRAWLELLPPDTAPAARLTHVVDLAGRIWNDHPAAKLALAEAALRTGDHARARDEIGALGTPGPAAMALLAELDQAQYGDTRSAGMWRARQHDAPPDHAWVCSACHNAHAEWFALCPACHEFATLKWETPRRATPVPALSQQRLLGGS